MQTESQADTPPTEQRQEFDREEFDPEDVQPEDPETDDAFTPDAFVPDTPEKADWVLSKIADARARAARVRANAEMIARQHDAEAEALEWRFGAALQALCRQQIAGTRRKSLRLLNGVLGFRRTPAAVRVTDPAAALVWARLNLPGAVSEGLDRKALTAALLSTGEAVSFAAYEEETEQFYVK